MPDEAAGTPGTPLTIETLSKHYKAALDSFQDCARAELAMIDIDAKLKAAEQNQSEEQQLKFAENEKRVLLKVLRSHLIEGITVISDLERWDRVRLAQIQSFEGHAADLKTKNERETISKPGTTPNPPLGLAGVFACPPGFVKADGVCVPIQY